MRILTTMKAKRKKTTDPRLRIETSLPNAWMTVRCCHNLLICDSVGILDFDGTEGSGEEEEEEEEVSDNEWTEKRSRVRSGKFHPPPPSFNNRRPTSIHQSQRLSYSQQQQQLATHFPASALRFSSRSSTVPDYSEKTNEDEFIEEVETHHTTTHHDEELEDETIELVMDHMDIHEQTRQPQSELSDSIVAVEDAQEGALDATKLAPSPNEPEHVDGAQNCVVRVAPSNFYSHRPQC